MYYIKYAIRYINKRFIRKIIKYIFICSFIFLLCDTVNAKDFQCVDINTEDPNLWNMSYYGGTTTAGAGSHWDVGALGISQDYYPFVFAFGFIPNNEITEQQNIKLTLISNNQSFYPDNWGNFNGSWFGSSTMSYDTFNVLNNGFANRPSYVNLFENSQVTVTRKDYGTIELSIPFSRNLTSAKYLSYYYAPSTTFKALAHRPFTIDRCYFTVNTTSTGTGSSTDLSEVNNKLNDIATKQQETNDKLDDLNDNLIDDTVNAEDKTNSLLNYEYNDLGVITQLVGLPLDVLRTFSSNLSSGTCNPISFTIPLINYSGQFSCLSSLIPSSMWTFLNIIGDIIGAFILYKYFKKLYKDINKMTDLKDVEVVEE